MSIRISEENLALIHQKANKAKLNFTDYVTRACLGKHIVIIEGLDGILKEQKAILRVFIRKIQVFEKTEKYSRTAGNTIIIHFTFQPYADTDFITINFREELLEAEQAEIA